MKTYAIVPNDSNGFADDLRAEQKPVVTICTTGSRAVIAAGPDSRLLRAVLEPWCPVPFVAWPSPALPGRETAGRTPRNGPIHRRYKPSNGHPGRIAPVFR